MSDTSSAAKPTPAEVPKLEELEIQGEVRLRASVSMLFTDILSQEINTAISAPETVGLLQKHLQNRSLDQLGQRELQPLLENVPESIFELAKEAAFSTGALVKRIPCQRPIKVGERFLFRGSGLIAELELKDGRIVAIRPLHKR